jgi:hypothetical protein
VSRAAGTNVQAALTSFAYVQDTTTQNSYLSEQTDSLGVKTRFERNSRGLPTKVTEAFGTALARVTSISWDSGFNRPLSIAAPGLTSAFVYNANNQVTKITQTDTTTITLPYKTKLPRSIKLVPAASDGFLMTAGLQLFAEEAISDVMMIVSDHEAFDTVFLEAQEEMIAGKSYESTRLNELLVALSKSAKRIALWYGDDYADLETVHDVQGLTRLVREGLLSPSIEAYVMFVRQ